MEKEKKLGLESIMWQRLLSGRFKQIGAEAGTQKRLR